MSCLLPPLPDVYALHMDARAWNAPLLDVETDRFAAQLALKARILAGDLAYYIQCPPEAEPAAWEALELLLPHAARTWPAYFGLTQSNRQWVWTNSLLETATTFTPGQSETLPRPVWDWLGRQFQEDLVLMDARGDDDEIVCVAGHVCFGSGWALEEKLGQPLLAIHAPVPEFAKRAGPSADLLLRRLKPGRPVGRWNWTFSPTDRLNLAPALAHEWQPAWLAVTPENAGTRCFLRRERQTLSRLPRTGAILFTIHTYLTPIGEIAADPQERRRLLAYVQSLPPAILAYRGMTPYGDALLAYLTNTSAGIAPEEDEYKATS